MDCWVAMRLAIFYRRIDFFLEKKSINPMTGSIYTFGVGNHFFYIRMMTNPAIRLGDISTYMKKMHSIYGLDSKEFYKKNDFIAFFGFNRLKIILFFVVYD